MSEGDEGANKVKVNARRLSLLTHIYAIQDKCNETRVFIDRTGIYDGLGWVFAEENRKFSRWQTVGGAGGASWMLFIAVYIREQAVSKAEGNVAKGYSRILWWKAKTNQGKLT